MQSQHLFYRKSFALQSRQNAVLLGRKTIKRQNARRTTKSEYPPPKFCFGGLAPVPSGITNKNACGAFAFLAEKRCFGKNSFSKAVSQKTWYPNHKKTGKANRQGFLYPFEYFMYLAFAAKPLLGGTLCVCAVLLEQQRHGRFWQQNRRCNLVKGRK